MVEEATAASHSLKSEAERLQAMIARFTLAGTAGRPSVEVMRPRQAMPKRTVAATRGNAARKLEPAQDDWAEF
jgi:methyl-accepting chemotaxis protein